MSAYEAMVEAAQNELHQHGDLNYLVREKQTDRWQDCPRRDAHEGAGKKVVDAVLAALPPSIVVDGKVAEVWPVLARLMERDHNLDVSLTNFMDAAREVAGREEA